jgi:hypothetical protein
MLEKGHEDVIEVAIAFGGGVIGIGDGDLTSRAKGDGRWLQFCAIGY